MYLLSTWSTDDKDFFLATVQRVYATLYPVGHPLHGGPKHAIVAQEFGRRRPRRPHLHLAAGFEKRDKWRAAQNQLRRAEGLQVVQYEGLAFLLGTEPGPAW